MSLHPRAAVAAAAAALLLAGCGSSSSGPQAAQTTGPHPSVSATPTAEHPGPAHQHHAAPHPSGSAGVRSSTSSSPPSAPKAKPTAAAASPGSGSSGAGGTGPKPIAVGSYTYTQTGSQKIAGFSQAVDPTSTLVVDKAKADGEQTSHQQSGSQPPSDQILLFDHKGMFLVSEVERASYAGHTETISCRFHPGVPYPPWPVTVGAKVSAHAACGPVDVTATGKVTGRRTATVGGTTLSVYVIDVTLTTSGQVDSTSTDTEWFSPALRLPVRSVNTINGKFGPFSFSGTVTQTLTSTTPH